MNGKELNKVNKFIFNTFKDKLKDDLFGLIYDGSVGFGDFKNNWSDIDFILVVNNNSLKVKQKIAKTKLFLEKKYKKHLGINVIIKQEFQNPINPTINLDGKTLQALVELEKYPERLFFCKDEKIKFYIPSKKEIKEYCLSNIAMFLLRDRKDLTTNYLMTLSDYKKMAERGIRASFIIVKLSIQYFSLYISKDKEDVLEKVKTIFPDFDFTILENNLLYIKKWNDKKIKKELYEILNSTDDFIEKFCKYIFNKTKKAGS